MERLGYLKTLTITNKTKTTLSEYQNFSTERKKDMKTTN
jgi:hypothetical protein